MGSFEWILVALIALAVFGGASIAIYAFAPASLLKNASAHGRYQWLGHQ